MPYFSSWICIFVSGGGWFPATHSRVAVLSDPASPIWQLGGRLEKCVNERCSGLNAHYQECRKTQHQNKRNDPIRLVFAGEPDELCEQLETVCEFGHVVGPFLELNPETTSSAQIVRAGRLTAPLSPAGMGPVRDSPSLCA